MKRTLAFALWMMIGLCAAQTENPAAPPNANALYQQGLVAVQEGNVARARECFRGVLQLRPNDPNATYQLGQLKERGPEISTKGRELKFSKIMLPQVDFDNSTLAEGLTALSALVEKSAGADSRPSFIIQDPTGKLAGKAVTLHLKNIPAKAVLTYLLEQTDAKANFEEHAIVVRPKPGS
jgi:tetratricopeptide (TPR) repeat protein